MLDRQRLLMGGFWCPSDARAVRRSWLRRSLRVPSGVRPRARYRNHAFAEAIGEAAHALGGRALRTRGVLRGAVDLAIRPGVEGMQTYRHLATRRGEDELSLDAPVQEIELPVASARREKLSVR